MRFGQSRSIVAPILLVLTVLAAGLATAAAPGGAHPHPPTAVDDSAESPESPSQEIVLAARFLLAETTKADALEAVERLRGTRAEVQMQLSAVEADQDETAAAKYQQRLDRLERRLSYQWTRWRRANRRAFLAKQAAGNLQNETTKTDDAASEPAPADGPTPDQWESLRQCESGGNYQIVSANGLYYGAYQFSLGTWASVGGSGNPAEATVAEQDRRAQILFSQRGSSPWPHCGRYL